MNVDHVVPNVDHAVANVDHAVANVDHAVLNVDHGELGEFAGLHARAQGLDGKTVASALARIEADGDPLAWPRVWSELGEAVRKPLDACAYFVLARFPYPADDVRVAAGKSAVAAFDTWRRKQRGIERREFALPSGDVAAWTANLHVGNPVLLIMGGIISVKEQWAPFLKAASRLGVGVIVTEMPSVGENTAVYGKGSDELIPEILDALGARICAAGVHVVGLSFAGHLALSSARHDPRISSIHTVGAPVAGVFSDPEALPATTTATLAHLSGGADLSAMALSREDLAKVRVPVRYVASRRDEIIPRREWELLAESIVDFEWVEFDDVHGSPNHLADTRMWLLRNILTQLGDRRARLFGLLLALRGRAVRGGQTRVTP